MESEIKKAVAPTIEIEVSPIIRTIGVEIECLVPHSNYDDMSSDVSRTGCDIHGDGSISGAGEGTEVVTKPLAGKAAEDTITSVCRALNSNDAEVNSSTGLHVHADAKELHISSMIRSLGEATPRALRIGEIPLYVPRSMLADYRDYGDILKIIESVGTLNAHGRFGEGRAIADYNVRSYERAGFTGFIIPSADYDDYYTFAVKYDELLQVKSRLFSAMRFFAAVDPVLRSLIPATRRHNRFCQPLEKMARIGGKCPATTKEILSGIVDRYCGINLRALNDHGTIECRYHAGTTNATKIIHWARLWEGCVRIALSENAQGEADILAEVCNGRNKLDMLTALCGLPESTCEYLRERYSAQQGSDARRSITYIKNKQEMAAKNKAAMAVTTV